MQLASMKQSFEKETLGCKALLLHLAATSQLRTRLSHCIQMYLQHAQHFIEVLTLRQNIEDEVAFQMFSCFPPSSLTFEILHLFLRLPFRKHY